MSSRDPLADPARAALDSVHARFAIRHATAARYPADVAPFAALASVDNRDIAALRPLLTRGEHVYLFGDRPPPTPGIAVGDAVDTLQMLGPQTLPPAPGDMTPTLTPLGADDAAAMVALTTLAFPGFYRARTHEMGEYWGIRVAGELVAMAGERLALTGAREISGVCTHPAHTGKGYAQTLIRRLLRAHADAGLRSFLHVVRSNSRAIEIYHQLGFRDARQITLWPVSLIYLGLLTANYGLCPQLNIQRRSGFS